MRRDLIIIFLALALPAVLVGQTTHKVPLSRLVLPDIAHYHGSILLSFSKPAAGAVTVPPQWQAVEMAEIVDNPRLEPAVAVRFRDGDGSIKYAVASEGSTVFDSSSVLHFHTSGGRPIAYFSIITRPTGSADTAGRRIPCQIVLSKDRVIARLAECREGILQLGNQDFRIRIYAPSIDNPFFDISSKAVCLIDMNRDGNYSWKWRFDDANQAAIPSERISLTDPFSVDGNKLKALSIDPEGKVFTCSDFGSDTAAAVGFKAPAFTIADLEGTPRTLADLRGRVVLMTFWSTGCPYCERIRPQLDTLVAHCDTTQFQAICAAAETDRDEIAEFLRDQPYGGIIVPYAEQLWQTYDARGTTPVYYVIDRDGSVVYSGTGASAFSVVEQILATKLTPRRKG